MLLLLVAALIPEGESRWNLCPLPCLLRPRPAARTRVGSSGGSRSPRPRSLGSELLCGCPRDTGGCGGAGAVTPLRQGRGPEGQCGDIPGRASAARGARRRRGSGAAPSGGHGCGRAPLSAAISAAFPSAAAAAREPLPPSPRHKHALRASSAPAAVSLRGNLCAGSRPARSPNYSEVPLRTAG